MNEKITGRSNSQQVTAVIPAYNEEDNIGTVLQVLEQVKSLQQIVVVDDGSNDNTSSVVKEAMANDKRLTLCSFVINQGKGKAMLTGAKASASDLIVFLDADLREVEPFHIEKLMQPVQEGKTAMTVGLFADGRWTTSLTHKLFPFLSGQRCINWPLFQDIYKEKINGWSIETALNLHAKLKRYGVKYVLWPGVTHAIRTEKRGILGYWSHVKMWWQIARYTFFFILHQNKTADQPSHSISYHTQWK